MENRFLKNTHLILSVIILFIALMAQVVYGFVWKSSIDQEVNALKMKLKGTEQDHEKINEIGLNLKNLMEHSGLKYIEL